MLKGQSIALTDLNLGPQAPVPEFRKPEKYVCVALVEDLPEDRGTSSTAATKATLASSTKSKAKTIAQTAPRTSSLSFTEPGKPAIGTATHYETCFRIINREGGSLINLRIARALPVDQVDEFNCSCLLLNIGSYIQRLSVAELPPGVTKDMLWDFVADYVFQGSNITGQDVRRMVAATEEFLLTVETPNKETQIAPGGQHDSERNTLVLSSPPTPSSSLLPLSSPASSSNEEGDVISDTGTGDERRVGHIFVYVSKPSNTRAAVWSADIADLEFITDRFTVSTNEDTRVSSATVQNPRLYADSQGITVPSL
ncbi:hypothetical protein HDV00_005364 [Rhizophlyctis rosea]|nr:hypothetical protein HDV00_005364 [Rhizophlyctis rosea]